jgi:hypothetical protein
LQIRRLLNPSRAKEGACGQQRTLNRPSGEVRQHDAGATGKMAPRQTEKSVSFWPARIASGDVPTLGRECATEAEAIIEAFREKVNLYRVTEFQTRADIGRSGEPILRKETLKKNNPAS